MKQSLRALILGALFFFVTTAWSAQHATITVDGNKSDWTGLESSLDDPENDHRCTTTTDIKHLYVAKDDTYAYLMVETYGTPINPSAVVEINIDFKPGQHILHSPTADLHTNISGGNLNAFDDTDLDGTLETYTIQGYQIAWGEVMEIRIPLSELENTDDFLPTFVNTWDHTILPQGDNQGCDASSVTYAAPVTAVDFGDGWSEYLENDVSFSPNGTTLSTVARGTTTFAWGGYSRAYNDAVGVAANVNVSSTGTNPNNDVEVGLRKIIGYTSEGNSIQAVISVGEFRGGRRINYQVRERNPEHETVKHYARGVLGNYSGAWELNDSVQITFASLGNTVAFGTPSSGAFIKIRLYEWFTPALDSAVEVFAWAGGNGAGEEIVADVSELFVLTKNNLQTIGFAGFYDGDITLNGNVGMEDVIELLRVLSGY